MILDDLDSRPGSATSLLRTVVGLHLRELGGWVAVADLVGLLDAAGVSPPGARGAISRVKAKGLLVAESMDGRPGYRLAPGADVMLARGDRRIFSYRQQADDDPWLLVSYSIPERHRDARHQLRRHLAGIGCGTVADARDLSAPIQHTLREIASEDGGGGPDDAADDSGAGFDVSRNVGQSRVGGGSDQGGDHS